MIGGVQDVYSKTLVGVRSDGDGAPQLLILDPHYVGGAAHSGDVEALRAGGWAAWKPLGAAMSAASVYNIALPTRGAGGQEPPEQEGQHFCTGLFGHKRGETLTVFCH